jgi:GTP-binding protein
LRLPEGTIVYDNQTGERVAELLKNGNRIILLRGGKGGLGNEHFKTSINQAPRHTVPGALGERGVFRFEMKVIADVGLVGFPNAGKSTLTNLFTHTNRPTGPHPFTTIHPKVGTVEFPDPSQNFRLADIPGLIGGAHCNRGLGFRFLRHIERCSMLLFVLDMGGVDGRFPWDDLRILREELGHYRADLLHRPATILANKMDVPAAAENLAKLRESSPNLSIIPFSCAGGKGVGTLKNTLCRLVHQRG